ncbi:hypothetical protein [Ferrovibrio terrae]|uniref:hypothetical protein n=1 Tax=Ferrovibrio terrae TaxID=2594003 RepID=UPI0031382044
MTLRILVTIAGSYLLGMLWTLAVVDWWPGSRADAVLVGTVSAFAVSAGTAIWAFAAISLRRMLVGFALAVAMLGTLVLTGR